MALSASSSARDTRIMLQRAVEGRDAMNAPVPTGHTDLIEVHASVSYGTGQERRTAGQEGGSVPATFRVLRTPKTASLTIKDRIMLGGAAWDITSIVPAEGRAALDITATRAA